MKKISRIEYCAGFEPLQSGMEQDEGSRILLPTMKSLGGADNKKDQAAESAPVEEKKEEKIDFSKVEIEPLFKEFVDFDTFSKSDFRAVKVKECVAVPKSKKLLQFTHLMTELAKIVLFSAEFMHTMNQKNWLVRH